MVATASGNSSNANNNNSQKLTNAVDLLGLTEHLTAFQLIGRFSDGNRLAGKEGHDRSAQYVYARLKLAGYKPRYQEFTYTFNGNGSLPVLSVVAGTNYAYPFQFRTPTSLVAADSGDFTRSLIAIDLNIPSTGGSTSGCEPTDFPVLTTTFAVGQELANGAKTGDTGRDVRVNVDIVTEELTTRNVIAETSGRDNNVVVGAHLDSVEDGPGINDNGSGSSAILEIAEEMRKVKPKNQVRFMWYSAEESGLLGSEHYVETLPEAERRKIAAMLNFDMLASPNFVRFVYDGDQNAFPPTTSPRAASRRRRRSSAVARTTGRHRRRHPGRWSVQRCRGDQDRGGGGHLRRRRRRAVRPVLPHVLRHARDAADRAAGRPAQGRGAERREPGAVGRSSRREPTLPPAPPATDSWSRA